MTRKLLAALAAAAVLAVLGVLFVHAHGLGDITIGTDRTYCGLHTARWSVEVYCQSGH